MTSRPGIPVARRAALAAALAITAAFAPFCAHAGTPVSIRFSWKMKGEFAPLYVALDKGYFAAENLDVKLGEGSSSQTALGAVVQGQDQAAWLPGVYAVQAISNGMPVKVVGLYNRAAPNVLLSRSNKPVVTPQDLAGKVLGHSAGDVGTTFVKVLCQKNGIDCAGFRIVSLAAQARVPALVAGQVDAISVYTSNDVPILEDKFGANTFAQLDLPKYGLHVMGASLVVGDAWLAENPAIATGLLKAIDRGFADTLADPNAAAQIMLKHWQTPLGAKVVTRQIEALNAAVKPVPGKSLGWVASEAVEETLDALLTAGEIKQRRPTDAYLNNDHAPRPGT